MLLIIELLIRIGYGSERYRGFFFVSGEDFNPLFRSRCPPLLDVVPNVYSKFGVEAI